MKKGFTLIELLAVIVILAIIALIAFPTISGLVEKAKKGGAEQSANGYNDAINKQMALNLMDSNDANDINKGIIDAPFDSKYNLKVKGQTPTKGWVEVTKNGVNRYSLVIGEYVVTYDGENTTVIKGTEPADKPSQFDIDDWSTIITNVRNNNTSAYHVGDTKEIDVGEFGKHTVRIVNMSTPSECSTDGFSQTACGFVLEFEDILTMQKMNNRTTNKGGWQTAELRTYINNNIYNNFPDDLKTGVINTYVVSGHGKEDNTNFITDDKLYLLSDKEITGRDQSKFDSSSYLTRHLDYYLMMNINKDFTTELRKKYNGKVEYWRLRTADYESFQTFACVGFQGEVYGGSYGPSYLFGVSPAFRIG